MCFVRLRVVCVIVVDRKTDTSAVCCYQHISCLWPKATPVICGAPQRALGSEQINLQVRTAQSLQELKLSPLLVWGQGVRLPGEDQGGLRSCSTSLPVNYCSFAACMKGTMWITSIVIIFLRYSVHLLFTVNIPGRRDKPRLHFKNPESQSMLCLSFWCWWVRMGQGCHQIFRSIFKLWGQIL